MEYGEAVTADTLAQAVAIARTLLDPRESSAEDCRRVAAVAVQRCYCVCVTDGEDAAEQHFSDVHRTLVADVAARLAADLAADAAAKGASEWR
jgi:hypothetical protein